MTKRDFQLIANEIQATRSAIETSNVPRERMLAEIYAVNEVALNLTNALAAVNPRFDRSKFLAACEGR